MTSLKFDNLMSWVRNAGGYVDSSLFLDVSNESNRSLKVKNPQRPGAVLIRVPDCCLIGGKDIYETCMNLLLEMNKGRESFFHPYLDMLPGPEQLTHLPIYTFTRSDLPKIQKCSVHFAQQLNAYFNEIETFHTEHLLKSDLIPLEYKKYHYALYALALYHSRAWNQRGFIPLIDLSQHENNMALSNSINFADEMSIYINQKYLKRGEELAWFYNLNSNLGLYANYGIPSISPNLIPSAVSFDGDKETELVKYQKECFKLNGVNIDKKELKFVYTETGLHPEALMVGRILQLSERDLGYLKLQNDGRLEPLKINEQKVISMRNEFAMVKLFLKQLTDYKVGLDSSDESEDFPVVTACVKKNKEVVAKCIKQLQDHWGALLTGSGVEY